MKLSAAKLRAISDEILADPDVRLAGIASTKAGARRAIARAVRKHLGAKR